MKAVDRNGPSAIPSETAREEIAQREWTVHLLRRDPSRSLVAAATVGVGAMLGYLLFHSVVFATIGALLVFSSAAEYLLPIRYRLTNRRACAAYGLARMEIEWSRVRRVLVSEDAVKLSPLAMPSRLDAFRGVVLRLPDSEDGLTRESLLGLVEELRVQAWNSALASEGKS